jgi:hypothetical protein
MMAIVVPGVPVVPAIDIARYRVARKSADHRAGDNAAEAAMRHGTADSATTNSTHDRTCGVVVTVAVGLGRSNSAAEYDCGNANYSSDPVQHETLRAN